MEKTNIEKMDGQRFGWLEWRNGDVLSVFKFRHRYSNVCLNTDKIRRSAVGYCIADSIPCRPKINCVAVMFCTDDVKWWDTWWTHFTNAEFIKCFPEFAMEIRK
jgi:hypothetical protein